MGQVSGDTLLPWDDLVEADFDEKVQQSGKLWLVMFHVRWCGTDCERLKSVIERVATTSETGGLLSYGLVDCRNAARLCDKYTISVFPTIYAIRGAFSWEYHGRDYQDDADVAFVMERFIRRIYQPALKFVNTEDELRRFVADTRPKPVIFLWAAGLEDVSRLYESVSRNAQPDADFVTTTSEAVASKIGGAEASTSVPFTAKLEFNEPPIRFVLPLGTEDDGERMTWNMSALTDWVKEHKFPLISVVDECNFYDLRNARKFVGVLVTEHGDQPVCDHQDIDSILNGAARSGDYFRELSRNSQYQEKLHFALMDSVRFSEFLDDRNFDNSSLPRLIVLIGRPGETKSFCNDQPEDALDMEHMQSFLARCVTGRINNEFEGYWGLPDRAWRQSGRYVPLIKYLDWFPRYVLIFAFGVPAVMALLLYLVDVCLECALPDAADKDK